MRGVYGEHSKHNDMNWGGPECAATIPTNFRVFVILLLLPYQIYVYNYAFAEASKQQSKRYSQLEKARLIKPCLIEKMCGLLNIIVLLVTAAIKYQEETLVFMLNPCHFVTVRNLSDHTVRTSYLLPMPLLSFHGAHCNRRSLDELRGLARSCLP